MEMLIWKGNQHWDSPLSLEDYPDLNDFLEEVANLSTIHLKRYYVEPSQQIVHKGLHFLGMLLRKR